MSSAAFSTSHEECSRSVGRSQAMKTMASKMAAFAMLKKNQGLQSGLATPNRQVFAGYVAGFR